MFELEDVPVRRADISAAEFAADKLIYSEGADQAFSLNASAGAIFELCDGEHSVAEIGDILAADLDRPLDEILQDVRNAVTQLYVSSLIELRS